jgi:hypothetical protein
MAFIANTAFEARIVNDRFDDLANIAGKFFVSTTATDCSAGLLCVRNGQVPCEGFGPSVLNENTWYMNAATDSANIDDVIYACNTYDTQLISAPDGNNYFVGTRTLGLGAPAGRYCTFTRIDFDGQSVYRFGIGNLDGALGSNTYFTIDDGLLVPAASAPATAGSIYFELHGTGNFTEGTTSSFQYVDVVAKRVSVA